MFDRISYSANFNKFKHLTDKDHDHLVQRVLLSLERVDLREAQFPKQTVYRRSPVTPEMMAAKKIEFQREREELLKGYAKDKGKQTAEQTAEQKRQRGDSDLLIIRDRIYMHGKVPKHEKMTGTNFTKYVFCSKKPL